ncbi:TolC family protein [Leptolyngbya sp. GGD]|uniref:TolC family protein n=1 Tax=Leptolyngbya sp. GGD TaxID=2997907 RepID=UPI00227CA0B3|nr:TolC family protein [Leptolyngbya sp. GGD]MCY6493756.1 TolC family protein [Leptolyngbya sp. GGD]
MAIGSVDAATANPTSPQNEPEPASNSSVAAQPQSRVLVAAPPSVAKPSIFNQFKPENSSPTLTLAASRDLEGDPTPPWVIDLKPNAIAQTPSVVVPTKPVTTKPNPKPNPTAQAPTTPRPSAPLPRPTTSTPTPTPTPTPPLPTSPPPTPGASAQTLLTPSPNRLLFPTKPGEVQVRSVQPITLQQALDLAERNNRDLEIARLQVEQSRAAIREARAGNFPTLALTSNLTRSGSAFITQDTQQNSFLEQLGIQSQSGSSTRTAFGLGAQLNYDIFTSGLRPAQIEAAERRSRTAELQLEQTREELRLQVSNDYYNLQNADSQVAINEAAVRNAEANLRDSRAQETAGLGTRFDTLRAEVNLANAQQQLRNSQATQEINRRQLAQRLSLSETATLTAADPVQPAGTWTIPLEDSIVLAYKNRAELEEQLVQREISQAQIRAARAQNGVTLGFVASYDFSRSGTVDTDANNSDNYSLGLQARWNLFDGGATNAQISQRERDREIAEARFAQNRNQIRFQVEQAFANLQANFANINTTQQSVAQAEEALRLAILRFQAGVGTQTDRISAEAALTQAQGNRVSAIIGYNQALAQLRRAVSNIRP